MKVEYNNGVTLDYSEPHSPQEPVIVSLCIKGKRPEKIGMILRTNNEETGIPAYQAYNQNYEMTGCQTDDWGVIENMFSKHGYNHTRSEIQQDFIRLAERMNLLRSIHEKKSQEQNLNKQIKL